MITGRRPIRSDRLPTNGMTAQPYAFWVAYADPKTVATIGIVFISAIVQTRSMFGQEYLNASTTGDLGLSPSASSFSNTGVSSTVRRMMTPATMTTKLSRNGIRQPQLRKFSGDRNADSGMNTPAARI